MKLPQRLWRGCLMGYVYRFIPDLTYIGRLRLPKQKRLNVTMQDMFTTT